MIHPDIKKFWENSGHTISSMRFCESEKNNTTIWLRQSSTEIGKLVARRIENEDIVDMWYFSDATNGKRYTEEEMLKSIKLKVFW